LSRCTRDGLSGVATDGFCNDDPFVFEHLFPTETPVNQKTTTLLITNTQCQPFMSTGGSCGGVGSVEERVVTHTNTHTCVRAHTHLHTNWDMPLFPASENREELTWRRFKSLRGLTVVWKQICGRGCLGLPLSHPRHSGVCMCVCARARVCVCVRLCECVKRLMGLAAVWKWICGGGCLRLPLSRP